MATAAVAALLAILALVVPSLLVFVVAFIALFSRPNIMSTAAAASSQAEQKETSVPVHQAKTGHGSAERKEKWSGREKQGERKGETAEKENKQYTGEQGGAGRGHSGDESPTPEPYTVRHTFNHRLTC